MSRLSEYLTKQLINDGWVTEDKQDELSGYIQIILMKYKLLNMSKENQEKLIKVMQEKLNSLK